MEKLNKSLAAQASLEDTDELTELDTATTNKRRHLEDEAFSLD